ncbi:kinase-like protein [Cadophora sp. DSE1049]|nr:kinase-like protein [Cadophora sp. DSE1049]
MQYRDLSKAVLSLQPRSTEADRSLHIPQNQPFITQERNEIETLKRTDRDATPHLVPPTIKITVQTDKIPRNKHGWMFGSDPQICDYLLDTDKSHGVSGAHFEICYNWESTVLLIRNLSHNQLGIETDEGLEIIRHTRALCQADCHISVGLLTFHLEIPDRGELQPLYDKNLEIHRNIVTGAVPELSSLAVKQRGEATPAVQEVLATAISTSTNKYIRRYRLGAGISGIVYNGIEKSSGNEVALKDFRDKRTAEKISAEIEILRGLAHVHITRYIDVVSNPEPLLVMEFIGGGNLATLRNVSLCETLLMGQQTSQAVSYLHDNGITHRDIKPANILIVSRGRGFNCKVADFGESSVKPILETYCGTSMYQAPEVLNPPYSKAVDIWSLGIILVEYWYDWYPLCLNELPIPPRDSWLPDTQRSGVPGAETFLGNKVRELDWTTPAKLKWHAIIHQRLEEEDCPMAQILLQMLEVDPVKRIRASFCRYRLDSIPLPDESGTRQELRVSHKRNFEQAGLDDPSTSRYTCRNPQQLVIETTRAPLSQHSRRPKQHAVAGNDQEGSGPALPTIVESLEIAGTVYQPHFSKTTPLSGSVRQGNASPPRRSRIERLEVPTYMGEQIIRLDQQMREINASDILKAASRGNSTKLLYKYARHPTPTGTYISYKDGKALLSCLNLSKNSIESVIQAMEKGQVQVRVPKEKTHLRQQYEQVGGIIHLDPDTATMNATNLVSAAGFPKHVGVALRKNFFTSYTIIRAHGREGTYVTYKDGLKLCDYLNLPRDLIEEAMEKKQKLVRIPPAKSRSRSRSLSSVGKASDEVELQAHVENDVTVSRPIPLVANQTSQEVIGYDSSGEQEFAKERDNVSQEPLDKKPGSGLQVGSEEEEEEEEAQVESKARSKAGSEISDEELEDEDNELPEKNECNASGSAATEIFNQAIPPPRAMSQLFLLDDNEQQLLQPFHPHYSLSSQSTVSSNVSSFYLDKGEGG